MVNKKRQTADEFLTELETDPEYQRRKQERDSRRQNDLDEMHRAEAPVVQALREAGIRVASIWDLVNTRARYPVAVPVLLDHLQRAYPDAVLSGIARALAVPDAKSGWSTLLKLFRMNQEQKPNGLKTALACALAGAADDDVMDDVIELIQDPSHGEHRIMLLPVIAASSLADATKALERAAEDPQLAKEAKFQLRLARRRKKT